MSVNAAVGGTMGILGAGVELYAAGTVINATDRMLSSSIKRKRLPKAPKRRRTKRKKSKKRRR